MVKANQSDLMQYIGPQELRGSGETVTLERAAALLDVSVRKVGALLARGQLAGWRWANDPWRVYRNAITDLQGRQEQYRRMRPGTRPAPARVHDASAELAAAVAQARTAERQRIADIRRLGASTDPALVEACINDLTCTADMAARRFLEWSNARSGPRLFGGRRVIAPTSTAAAPDPDRKAVQEILTAYDRARGAAPR